jgi:gamma-glutamylcyclotransferase (GGCT)/AIG2-like uncharacterized protein YtfP
MTKTLFVYGTLMRGMRNHTYLEKARFIEEARTPADYELLFNGSIPAARSGSESIKGELYEVEDGVLDTLDVVEEISSKLYDRKEVEINGKKVILYIGGERMFSSDTWTHIPDGDYRALVEAK